MIETDDAPQATLTVSPRSQRRLNRALALSAGIVCLVIVLIPGSWRGSEPDQHYAFDLRVLQPVQEIPQVSEPKIEAEPVEPTEQTREQLAEERPAANDDIVAEEQHPEDPAAPKPSPHVDWYAALDRAAIESVEQAGKSPSMSPQFDELRLVARERYRKSEAPVKKPIWENVEKDQMGRTILRAGDCYRVLDDPSVANRWAQEHFTQYILFCGSGKQLPKELPFVADIVARYAYLQPGDGRIITDVPH
jgi:hypothetical protein